MNSRIEQIIEEIEEYIEGCKTQTFSSSKITVNKDELLELLTELRNATPDEIRRYQKIIANRDAILANAQAEADRMIQNAQIKTREMASEHAIMQQATAQAQEVVSIATSQAQEILDRATEDATNLRTAATEYTDSLLENIENVLADAVAETRDKYASVVTALSGYYDVVTANRRELSGAPASSGSSDDYDPTQINMI